MDRGKNTGLGDGCQEKSVTAINERCHWGVIKLGWTGTVMGRFRLDFAFSKGPLILKTLRISAVSAQPAKRKTNFKVRASL